MGRLALDPARAVLTSERGTGRLPKLSLPMPPLKEPAPATGPLMPEEGEAPSSGTSIPRRIKTNKCSKLLRSQVGNPSRGPDPAKLGVSFRTASKNTRNGHRTPSKTPFFERQGRFHPVNGYAGCSRLKSRTTWA